MNPQDPPPLDLREYEPASFPAARITDEDAARLYAMHHAKIEIVTPSFMTGGQWRLTCRGWVGYLPVSPSLSLRLHPKVPLRNLFGMWEYAYRLKGFEWPAGIMQADSLQEFYAQLASVLARNVRDRGRRGYYRAYVPRDDTLAYVRGQVDWPAALRAPWVPRVPCCYEDHTADISDNQILAWTLFVIARSGLCPSDVLATVRHAYHELRGLVELTPKRSRDCVARQYHRLNQDYQQLHALCRFFLENTGPTHEAGDRTMLPFLVDMAGLFELFVAEWLQQRLPPELEVRAQEQMSVTADGGLDSRIDLVIYDTRTRRARWVLDTKYKATERPAKDDFNQVVAYAIGKSCSEAILIYPTPLLHPLDAHIGNIRVRSLTFLLDGDLEAAGRHFLYDLLDSEEWAMLRPVASLQS